MRVGCDECGGGRDIPYFEPLDKFGWQCPLCGTKHVHEPVEVIKEIAEKKIESEKIDEVEEIIEVKASSDDFFGINPEGTVIEEL